MGQKRSFEVRMLFKPEHVHMILKGSKIRTRRLWKLCRVKVGNYYKCKTQMLSKQSFATIQVTQISKEKLKVSEAKQDCNEDAKKEGYSSWAEFKQKWIQINGLWNPEDEPFIIDFEVKL